MCFEKKKQKKTHKSLTVQHRVTATTRCTTVMIRATSGTEGFWLAWLALTQNWVNDNLSYAYSPDRHFCNNIFYFMNMR